MKPDANDIAEMLSVVDGKKQIKAFSECHQQVEEVIQRGIAYSMDQSNVVTVHLR